VTNNRVIIDLEIIVKYSSFFLSLESATATVAASSSPQPVPLLPQYSYANLGTDGQLYLPTMDASVLNLMPDAVPRDGAISPLPELSSMSLDRNSGLDAFLKAYGMTDNSDTAQLSVLNSEEMLQLFVDNPGPQT